MRNINDIINKINELEITEENYDAYEKLLKLPKEVYLPVIFGIVDGKVRAEDIDTISAKYREEVSPVKSADPTESLMSRLQKKYTTGSVTDVILDRSIYSEQLYIYNRLRHIGVPIPESDIENIFVAEDTGYRLTLNYDKIDLTIEDRVYASDHGLNNEQMKKLKLLRSYMLFNKYKKEE